MKINDFRNPEDALDPVVDAVEEAIRGHLSIKERLERVKTGGELEVELSFTEDARKAYAYVTIESDDSVSFTVGFVEGMPGGVGDPTASDQEMQNVPGDKDIGDALQWVSEMMDHHLSLVVVYCRGCGQRLGGGEYCQGCLGRPSD